VRYTMTTTSVAVRHGETGTHVGTPISSGCALASSTVNRARSMRSAPSAGVVSRSMVADFTHSSVDVVAAALVESFDFAGTPCGILAPLLDGLARRGASLTYIHREDVAVAFAVGVNLAGGHLCLFMQNSGFGQSVNVLASLVEPFRAPVPMIVSMRGTGTDTTSENRGMGRTTIPVLQALGIPFRWLSVDHPTGDITWLSTQTCNTGGPAAVLVEPGYFGWRP
jgi:sulfopyruvate decarboxylase subunit alpha